MSLRYALSAVFGLALSSVACVPVIANTTSITEAVAMAEKPILIELAARKSGGGHKGSAAKSAHKGGKVKAGRSAKVKGNKNVHVNRNVNVKKMSM